jgi:hypothetical protein
MQAKETFESIEANLANTTIPAGIELPTHRKRLKQALIEKHMGGKIHLRESFTMAIKQGFEELGQGLAARRPVWQMALVGLILVAVTAGVMGGGNTLARQGDESLARELALNSSALADAMGNRGSTDIDPDISVSFDKNQYALVIMQSLSPSLLAPQSAMREWQITLRVDLTSETIISYHYSRGYVTEVEIQQVKDVLSSDPRTTALISARAVLDFNPQFSGISGTGYAAVAGGNAELSTKILTIGINVQEWRYTARVDLAKGEVTDFGDPLFAMMTAEQIGEFTAILRTNPEIDALFSRGAVIRMMAVNEIMWTPVPVTSGVKPGNEIIKKLQVIIFLGDERYEAFIDGQLKQVTSFGRMLPVSP